MNNKSDIDILLFNNYLSPGEKIKKVMNKLNFTYDKLSKLSSLPTNHLINLSKNAKNASFNDYSKLLIFLGVDKNKIPHTLNFPSFILNDHQMISNYLKLLRIYSHLSKKYVSKKVSIDIRTLYNIENGLTNDFKISIIYSLIKLYEDNIKYNDPLIKAKLAYINLHIGIVKFAKLANVSNTTINQFLFDKDLSFDKYKKIMKILGFKYSIALKLLGFNQDILNVCNYDIGKYVKYLRNKNTMTQNSLAKKVNLTIPTISNIEKNKANPLIINYYQINKIFNK
ncbi:helix-turn-helix domain-containing protein [Apilactobacillus timberlakei]|uniref:helix-turn-helix domain-containing protein n=1 Tax=Apilactobacillus timberlakei TaxID=2008380 RepID=UPI001127FBA2|nr:helix-turn-helix domain-containing protein [Apilactobacillus timberlakei]TPR16294.1 helix-turn-helix domain-containing protein [Apilactobacillus timberlakei]